MEPPSVRIHTATPDQLRQLANDTGAQEVKLATEVTWNPANLKPKVVKKLADKLASELSKVDSRLTSANLVKIIEWVNRTPLNTYVHAKKSFVGIGISFFALSLKKKKVHLMIADQTALVGTGNEAKVVKAIHVYFNFKSETFAVDVQQVKLTTLLSKPNRIGYAAMRIKVQKALNNVTGIAQIQFYGVMAGKFGCKFITFMHRYNGGSLLQHVNSHYPDKNNPQKNIETILTIGRQLCNSLQKTQRLFVHRDVKWDNFLVEYDENGQIKRIDLSDFAGAAPVDNTQDPQWEKEPGALRFKPPEILCKDLHCEKEIFQLLQIKDRTITRTGKIDGWALGIILHFLYYGIYPACVTVLELIVRKENELTKLKAQNPTHPEIEKKKLELRETVNTIAPKWIAEIGTLNEEIFEQTGKMERLIQDLLTPSLHKRCSLTEARASLG